MRGFIAIILTILSTYVFAQEKKCDLEVLGQTYAGINKLTSDQIRIFLSVFDTSCKNNVEFSEFSNELLFSVLEKHTKKVLLALEKQDPEIEFQTVLSEFETPSTDTMDFDNLIKKVEKVKGNEQSKKKIIHALKVAKSKT